MKHLEINAVVAGYSFGCWSPIDAQFVFEDEVQSAIVSTLKGWDTFPPSDDNSPLVMGNNTGETFVLDPNRLHGEVEAGSVWKIISALMTCQSVKFDLKDIRSSTI